MSGIFFGHNVFNTLFRFWRETQNEVGFWEAYISFIQYRLSFVIYVIQLHKYIYACRTNT